MKTFKYETHLHTRESSACGTSSGADYIKAYIDAGYAGLFVTDHFFGGNTAIPRNLTWKERIKLYVKGYETALESAEKINKEIGSDFKVFFGIEQTFHGDDYLVYGLSPDWLSAHPQVETMTQKELFQAVNEQNGLMIQAHPFRLRDYIQAIHLHPRDVHGVEVYNAGNRPDENELAQLYAAKYNFPVTSGSDIHNVNLVLHPEGHLPIGGVEFLEPLKDVFDYATRIKNKEGKIIL
ncbi:MAG: PHP domain-containing protein [Treponema sp.]|nr:PHP domain-containing protein [Treponema sp.]